MSLIVDGVTVGSPAWHDYLASLRAQGIYHAPVPVNTRMVGYGEEFAPPDLDTPDWVRDSETFYPGHKGIYNPNWLDGAPAPRILKGTDHVDTVTNARIKRYQCKDVLQVANDDIFTTGDWERRDGKKKRLYDVPPSGEAEDPERSLEESKRRAKSKVRDIALCNRFTHMFTWTLDPDLIDRYDADQVYKKVRTFLSNATQRKGFAYVCIPEFHKLKASEEKPAIHMHGLCIPGEVQLTESVRKNGKLRKDPYGRQIYNMADWSFGWSTCVPLDENYERAVNYVTKYITKADEKIFGKWYLSSRSLTKAPDIIPLDRMNYESFRDESKLTSREQMETTIFRDVKILSEEYAINYL